MSDAAKCDRCGKLFEYRGGFVNYITLTPTSMNGFTLPTKIKGDLCDECSESLAGWWDEFREENE